VLQCVNDLFAATQQRLAKIPIAAYPEPGGDVVVIKKYPNRRMYDTGRSRYVNLEELTGMIRDGADVQVVDADSGADLTREILVQILVEVLRGGDLLPTTFLRRVIRASSDDPAHALIRQQIRTALDVLSAQMDQVEALFKAVPPPEPPPVAAEPAPPAYRHAGDDELAALRQRLAGLEARLKRS
jgi:polyhydroxyalkanoate synthesis repressor PhaR